MCHRFQAKLRMRQIVEEFALARLPTLPFESTDRYPGGGVVGVRLEGEREAVQLQWGLLPHWWKPSAKFKTAKAFQRMTFNARGETIHEKPSFRDAFRSRRVLIPATAFFEGDHYFGLANKAVFALAGLWETWTGEGDSIQTCTVVTTKANSLIAQYHPRKRMPVILNSEEAYSRWLDPDVTQRGPLEDLLQPFDADRMTCVVASDAVP